MLSASYIPNGVLGEYVENFWLYESASPSTGKERVLPNGAIELIINLRADRLDTFLSGRQHIFRGVLLCGVHSRYIEIDTAQQESLLGVCFKPGGAWPFFGVPISELCDMHLSLDDLWGVQTAELRDRLIDAPTPQAKFLLLEHTLVARIKPGVLPHPAVRYALRSFEQIPHAHSIAAVSDQVGLSQRHFIQLFRDEVGLTPKRFCRIRRFQRLLHQIHLHGMERDLTDIALGCGYFDQAHGIHEFRAFSGINPSTYLAQRGEHHNHVPIAT